MTADPRVRWAAALRVPASASADEALAALLRALPDTEFLPSAERVAAANALAGTAAPVGRAHDVDEALRDEVAGFAARFWSLAPPDRLATWAELSRRGADAVRLRELEPGLDVTAPPLADPAAEELAALVRELFVLPPRARAIRRNQWLLEHGPATAALVCNPNGSLTQLVSDAAKWVAAFAVLQRESPLAALEPRLQAALAPTSTIFVTLAEGASAATASPTRMSDEVTLAGLPDRVSHRRAGDTGGACAPGHVDGEHAYEAADRQRARSLLHGSLVALITLVGGCCVINRFLPHSGHDARRSPPTAWHYNTPQPAYTPPAPRQEFTDAQVAAFNIYERGEAAGIRGTPPRGYSDWVQAGRPRPLGSPPGQRTAYITEEQIRTFQAHDVSRGSWPPTYYADWVRAGRPVRPGPLLVSP